MVVVLSVVKTKISDCGQAALPRSIGQGNVKYPVA